MLKKPQFTYRLIFVLKDPDRPDKSGMVDIDVSLMFKTAAEARRTARMHCPDCVYYVFEMRDDGQGDRINRIWYPLDDIARGVNKGWRITDQYVRDSIRKGMPIKPYEMLMGVS